LCYAVLKGESIMSKSTVILIVVCFALLFTLAVVVTGKPLRPVVTPALPRSIIIASTEKGAALSLTYVPVPRGVSPAAHFSSRADALAAEKLVKEALRWADPKVRVMAPAPAP